MKFIKTITREYPYFALIEIADLGNKRSKEVLGFNFKNPLYISEQGLVTFYRSQEDIIQYSEKLIDLLNHYPQKVEELLKKYLKVYNRLKSTTQFTEFVEYSAFLWSLANIVLAIPNIFSKGSFWEEFGLKSPPQITLDRQTKTKLLKLANKCRKKTEKFFDKEEIEMLDDFLKKAKRQSGYVYYKNKFYVGNSKINGFLKQENIKFDDEKKTQSNLIKGQSACPGKIVGNTKIVFVMKDLSKIRKGDILVTSMTMPRYVPAMKKAAAIVTDEGGITCHAAIVSRELKIPCIIGTKIATKVLKDGDLVEVDAEKGIVRILKRVK